MQHQGTEKDSPAKSTGRASKQAKMAIFALLGLLLCGVGAFVCGKLLTPDYLNEELDSDTPRKASPAKQENSQASNPTEVLSKATASRSRLIDMAILRGKQMDRLEENDLRLAFLNADGRNQSKAELDKQYASLNFEYEKRKKRFGDEHPYTIETAIDKILLAERMQSSCEADIENEIANWLKFEKKLSAYALNPTVHNTDTHEMDRMGVRKLWKWGHDSGEILALLSWGHRRRQQTLFLVHELSALCEIPAQGTLDGDLAVHQELDIAKLCASQNEYAEAKKSIAVARKLAMKQRSIGISSSQHSMAMCLLEESRLSLAERDYAQAEALAREAEGISERSHEIEQLQGKALRADIMEQLARSLAVSPAKISDAIDNQEKCLALRKEEFGKEGTFTSATALDLCRMLRQRASTTNKADLIDAKSPDAVKAADLLNQILRFCQANQEADSEILRADRNVTLLLPQTHYELGCLQSACGNYKDARENLQKASDIDMSCSEPLFIPRKIADLDALSAVDLIEGRISQARQTVNKASNLLDAYVADVLPQLSLAEQIAFSDNIEKHMNSLLAVCQNDESLTELYTEMIRWKGFLTEEFRLRSRIIKEKAIPSINILLASHQKLSSKLLSNYVASAQTGAAMGRQAITEQTQKEEIERQINAHLKKSLNESLNISSNDLKQALKQNEALIDLYEFSRSPWDRNSHYGAIVTDAQGHHWLDLGDCSRINEALSTWRSYGGIRSLLADLSSSSSKPDASSANAWEQLRAAFYEPLSRIMPKQIAHVWVADESELTRLPWNVLLSEYGGGREFEVCQLDSPRELINLRKPASPSKREGILIVGGIDYSKHVPPAPPLKNALSEVQEIQKEMEANKIACNVQSDFLDTPHPSKQNIMQGLSKCRMAHVVTHGFFNESDSSAASADRSAQLTSISSVSDSRSSNEGFQIPTRNPLIESGLLISKANAGESGFLTAEDLLDANLDGCKLVTLSACETARGREISSQGVLGLRSALMGAGSKTVLLSLWPVPDRPTGELMKAFYKRILAGDTPAMALKEAQATVRKDKKWQAPYYWAAWILVGDGWESIK